MSIRLSAALLWSALALMAQPARIVYPEDHSIFPPEIAPPTFLFQSVAAGPWRVEIEFPDGAPPLHLQTPGDRLRVGDIDPRAVSNTNRLPEVPDLHTWSPDPSTWTAIKRHTAATIAIGAGRVRISTSADPVGAPIFFRDVPLMPSELEPGLIKPLAHNAIPLITWRLRDIAQPASRLLLKGLHTCANCHSFSSDGKTLGMDVDGPENDKGAPTRSCPSHRAPRSPPQTSSPGTRFRTSRLDSAPSGSWRRSRPTAATPSPP